MSGFQKIKVDNPVVDLDGEQITLNAYNTSHIIHATHTHLLSPPPLCSAVQATR